MIYSLSHNYCVLMLITLSPVMGFLSHVHCKTTDCKTGTSIFSFIFVMGVIKIIFRQPAMSKVATDEHFHDILHLQSF